MDQRAVAAAMREKLGVPMDAPDPLGGLHVKVSDGQVEIGANGEYEECIDVPVGEDGKITGAQMSRAVIELAKKLADREAGR